MDGAWVDVVLEIFGLIGRRVEIEGIIALTFRTADCSHVRAARGEPTSG